MSVVLDLLEKEIDNEGNKFDRQLHDLVKKRLTPKQPRPLPPVFESDPEPEKRDFTIYYILALGSVFLIDKAIEAFL